MLINILLKSLHVGLHKMQRFSQVMRSNTCYKHNQDQKYFIYGDEIKGTLGDFSVFSGMKIFMFVGKQKYENMIEIYIPDMK